MSKSEHSIAPHVNSSPAAWALRSAPLAGVGGTPLFIERADGALYDVDGKAYIDYVGSRGPMVLANHPAISQCSD